MVQLSIITQVYKRLVYASIAALSCGAMLACAPQSSSTSTNSVAPKAQFATLTGKSFDTAQLKDQVVLVNFWATSCTTCVKKMPMMVRLFEENKTQGYRTIAVAMDYDPIAFVKNFTTERALPFDVVHDADGSIAKAFGNVKLTPTSFLIDRQGNIVKRYVGEPKESELQETIAALLKRA